MHPYEVLRRPIVTEKSSALGQKNQYVFEVATDANKAQVKAAVEKAFDVDVVAVNVMIVPGKMRRVGKSRGMSREWKKAVVTLKPEQKIELFQGV